MKSYRVVNLVFLILSLLGFAGWIVSRFVGPVLGVSYMGFHDFTMVNIFFVIAISLTELAFSQKRSS
jgi:uncharacterized membrane protein